VEAEFGNRRSVRRLLLLRGDCRLGSEPVCEGFAHHRVKWPLHGRDEVRLRIAKATETMVQARKKVEGNVRISGRQQGALQLPGIGGGHIVIELTVEHEHRTLDLAHKVGREMGVMLPEPWQIEF
jgi:hypothetical protein